MIFSLFKKSVANRRQAPRFSTNPDLLCVVSSLENEMFRSVQMIDISETGCSFVIPADLFEIGEQFHIQMGFAKDKLILAQGQITAQHVYFPFGADQYHKAVYRFSGKFEMALDRQMLQQIRQAQLVG